MATDEESWLPNLVGGVSIWKLAPDLNEAQFFGGRLLVPETEGSDSLPVRVEWDLTGLIPLAEARASHPEAVEAAIADFFACLERTAKVFQTGGSGYDKYREAFTIPGLDADDGAHYFFDPDAGMLRVINWGASPRKIRHEKEYLFGYEGFDELMAQEEDLGPGALGAAAAGAVGLGPDGGAVADAPPVEGGGEGEGDDAHEETAEEDGGGAWRAWLLVALLVLAVIAAVLFGMQDCSGEAEEDAGAETAEDAGALADVEAAADAGEAAVYSDSTDDAGPPATDLEEHRAQGDAGAVEPEAEDGAATDDAGAASGDADAGAEGEGGGAGSGGDGSGGEGSGGDGGGGGPPTDEAGEPIHGEEVRDEEGGDLAFWIPGAEGRSVRLPSRTYFHEGAVQWRILGDTGAVYHVATDGDRFRVYLQPGGTFSGLRVQWRGDDGDWRDH
jgi:hypothetical protein